MATRNRNAVTVNHANAKENIRNTKPSMVVVPSKGKRAVLCEISNRVNTLRGVEPIDRISLLQKKKVVVGPKQQAAKPVANVPEKPLVQIVKPVVKTSSTSVNNAPNAVDVHPTSAAVSQKREERDSFSTDLLKFEDIDEQDENNPILVSLYTNDIHDYLRTLEKKFPIKKGFLAGQEVTSKMRCVLVDWLVELYRSIDRKKLQLVGVTAMFIASKYEEMYSPDISDFVYITDKAYSKADILNMEMLIVKILDYSFGRPLPLHFLRRYSKAGKALPIHHTMAKYFLEQSLVHYEMCHYPPSLIAAAAIYLAFLVIGNDEEDEGKVIWTDTLTHYSTYSKDDVLPAVQDIAAIIVNAEDSKYQAVRKKYVHVKHMKISIRPELKSPIMLSIAARSNES
ncbi:G2/mitotic-specific cyclin-B isoform X3 [Temnothorax americanus]|uniref:G2/mitotic-specific cyclin-B isoform X3 n=1 Tax=Temnothorax americanus TaxID=1964332 RepID=UPI004068B744